MSTGLLALLDDVVALTKVAAASLDDVAAQTIKAGAKSAGVVIDDAAVTPRYVVGFAAERELPIVVKIAKGSLRNKLLFLLPAALLLSVVAPWLITPLLMMGGAFLCYEGAEKILHVLRPQAAHSHEESVHAVSSDPGEMEDRRVAGAIRTDFILSAEIMAITLAGIPGHLGFAMKASVLALVGVGITFVVYGAVALIVKADDMGVALSQSERGGSLTRGLGRGIVRSMPALLALLSVVGTIAMLWVGGSIFLHGLEDFGLAAPAHWLHDLAASAAGAAPVLTGLAGWFVEALGAAIIGIVLGAVLIPVAQFILAPAWQALRPGED